MSQHDLPDLLDVRTTSIDPIDPGGAVDNETPQGQIQQQATETSGVSATEHPYRQERQAAHQPEQILDAILADQDVTAHDLYSLKVWFDIESLKRTGKPKAPPHPRLISRALLRVVQKVSGRLDLFDDDTPLDFEMQLRAIIATLALLHHKTANAFVARHYDELERNLDALYGVLHEQPTSPSSANNLYLIQLALQYFLLFGCFRNRAQETAGSVADITYSSVAIGASQQYHQTRKIFGAISNLIRTWKPIRPRQHPLCILQEHVRRTTEALQSYTSLSTIHENDSAMLRATIKLISRKFDQDFSDFPDNLDNWHATRNALQLGPPEINNKYYFYGLLDCTAQITCFIGMETLLSGLYERLQDFVLTVDVRAFRWKALEVLLSCRVGRTSVKNRLLRLVDGLTERPVAECQALKDDVELVQALLQEHETRGLRPDVPTPIIPLRATSTRNGDDVQDESAQNRDPFHEEALQCWKADCCTSDPIHDFSPDITTDYRVILSQNCKNLAFWSNNEVKIFELSPTARQLTRLESSARNETYTTVVASERYLVYNSILSRGVSLQNTVVLYSFQTSSETLRFPSTNDQPRTVAVREADRHLWVVIARVVERKITVYKFDKNQPTWPPGSVFANLEVPEPHVIKHLTLNHNMKSVAAVSRQNVFLYWQLVGNRAGNQQCRFKYRHGTYSRDKGDHSKRDKGLTSVSFYQPPGSRNEYALCTSFPSRLRASSEGNWARKGEWSYITPIAMSDETSFRDYVESLTQFNHEHDGLTAGCVSNTANVFVVLERSKKECCRLYYLPLQKHPDGGIHCPDDIPIDLGITLAGKDEVLPRTSCAIGFDETGTRLYAADYKGKVWVREFVRASRDQKEV